MLLLDGGDQFQGTLIFTVYKGTVAADLMNMLEYDAMGLGNHEFDLGPENLRVNFLNNINFRALSANMRSNGDPDIVDEVWDEYTVLEKAGIKVGVVGFTTPETNYISNTGSYIVFEDLVPAIQAAVDELKQQGVNFIIALGHGGITDEIMIAEQVDGIALVVGGHSNTFLYTGNPPSGEVPYGPYPYPVRSLVNSRTVYVVQDYTFGKYLGELHVSVDESSGEITAVNGNPILLDKNVQQDEEVLEYLVPVIAATDAYGSQYVGRSATFISGMREQCRRVECAAGNLLLDAAVEWHVLTNTEQVTQTARQQEEWNIAPAGIWNGGGVRASLDRGDLVVKDLVRVIPFRNLLTLYRFRGDVLLAAFRRSVAGVTSSDEDLPGSFLQVSGFRVVFDSRLPEEDRLLGLQIRCGECIEPTYRDVDPDQWYDVILSDFLANGGDGYDMLTSESDGVEVVYEQGDLDSDMLSTYIGRHSPLWRDTEEQRITDLRYTAPVQCSPSPSHFTSPSTRLSRSYLALFAWAAGAGVVCGMLTR